MDIWDRYVNASKFPTCHCGQCRCALKGRFWIEEGNACRYPPCLVSPQNISRTAFSVRWTQQNEERGRMRLPLSPLAFRHLLHMFPITRRTYLCHSLHGEINLVQQKRAMMIPRRSKVRYLLRAGDAGYLVKGAPATQTKTTSTTPSEKWPWQCPALSCSFTIWSSGTCLTTTFELLPRGSGVAAFQCSSLMDCATAMTSGSLRGCAWAFLQHLWLTALHWQFI